MKKVVIRLWIVALTTWIIAFIGYRIWESGFCDLRFYWTIYAIAILSDVLALAACIVSAIYLTRTKSRILLAIPAALAIPVVMYILYWIVPNDPGEGCFMTVMGLLALGFIHLWWKESTNTK